MRESGGSSTIDLRPERQRVRIASAKRNAPATDRAAEAQTVREFLENAGPAASG